MKKHMDPAQGAGEEDGALFVWKQRRGGEIGKVRLWRDARTGQFVEAGEAAVEYLR